MNTQATLTLTGITDRPLVTSSGDGTTVDVFEYLMPDSDGHPHSGLSLVTRLGTLIALKLQEPISHLLRARGATIDLPVPEWFAMAADHEADEAFAVVQRSLSRKGFSLGRDGRVFHIQVIRLAR